MRSFLAVVLIAGLFALSSKCEQPNPTVKLRWKKRVSASNMANVAMSVTCNQAAHTCGENQVYLHALDTGKKIKALGADDEVEGWFTDVKFSADGKYLHASDANVVIKTWATDTFKNTRNLQAKRINFDNFQIIDNGIMYRDQKGQICTILDHQLIPSKVLRDTKLGNADYVDVFKKYGLIVSKIGDPFGLNMTTWDIDLYKMQPLTKTLSASIKTEYDSIMGVRVSQDYNSALLIQYEQSHLVDLQKSTVKHVFPTNLVKFLNNRIIALDSSRKKVSFHHLDGKLISESAIQFSQHVVSFDCSADGSILLVGYDQNELACFEIQR
ncbi:MAG: hypothetical protein ACRC8S_22735 [Fimbriiglobus sp.]